MVRRPQPVAPKRPRAPTSTLPATQSAPALTPDTLQSPASPLTCPPPASQPDTNPRVDMTPTITLDHPPAAARKRRRLCHFDPTTPSPNPATPACPGSHTQAVAPSPDPARARPPCKTRFVADLTQAVACPPVCPSEANTTGDLASRTGGLASEVGSETMHGPLLNVICNGHRAQLRVCCLRVCAKP